MPDNNTPVKAGGKDPLIKSSALPQTGKPYIGEAGSSEFGKSKYDTEIPWSLEDMQGEDYKYYRGEAQNGFAQLGLGVLRAGAKAGIEALKTPAYLYALGEATFTDKTLSESLLDNAVIKSLENVEDKYKEAMPVYQSYKSGKGGMLDNIFSTSFWGSEGADGVGYLLGLTLPSAGLQSLKLATKFGSGLAKMGVNAEKAMALGQDIELGLQTTINTVTESLGESKGVADDLKVKFDDMLNPDSENYNPINPKTGQNWTAKEVNEAIADGARNTFLLNTLFLAGPNLVMNKNLLGKFKTDKSTLDYFRNEAGELITNPNLKKAFANNIAFKSGEGLLAESFQEGAQTAIQNYETNKSLGLTDENTVNGLINEYINAFSTLEGQKSMFLGGVLGAGGGLVGAVRENNFLKNKKGTISKLIANNFEGFSVDNDPFQRDANNNIVVDENNQPVVDKTKLAKSIFNIASEMKASKIKDLAAFNNNKTVYDYAANDQFTRWALPFIANGELGMEILNNHLDKASKTRFMMDQEQLNDKTKSQFNAEKFKQTLKLKAENLSKIYNTTVDALNNSDYLNNISIENPKLGTEYINRLANAIYQESAKQQFLGDKIRQLDAQRTELLAGDKADLPQNQVEAERIANETKQLFSLLQDSKELLSKSLNPDELEKGYKAFKEYKQEEQKAAEEAQKQADEASKQAEQNQQQAEGQTEGQTQDNGPVAETPGQKAPTFDELVKQGENIATTANSVDAKADIEKRRQEELNKKSTQGTLKNSPLDDIIYYESKVKEAKERLDKITKEEGEFVPGSDRELGSFQGMLNKAKKKVADINAKYDAELAALESKPSIQPTATTTEEDQDLVSKSNITGTSQLESNLNPDVTFNNVDVDKGINAKINVFMMKLFKHTFKNGVFKFLRNEQGKPDIENNSNLNVNKINSVKIGDKVELKLIPLTQDQLKTYEKLKDFDGKSIGLYVDGELVGFVQQPHPVSALSKNPDASESLRRGLIAYRKNIIKRLENGEQIFESVIEKGTGNLYTVVNPDGTVKAETNVITKARPQDKINNTDIFVFADKDGNLVLPLTNFGEDIDLEIKTRLLDLNAMNLKPGAVFKLVKDLTGNWNIIPVYANKINDDVANKIINVINNTDNPLEIVKNINPYIYSSMNKGGANIILREEDNRVNVYIGVNKFSLNDIKTSPSVKAKFKAELLKLPQNILVKELNNKYTQERLGKDNTLLTNVDMFNGEYYVQPYIEYSQTINQDAKPLTAQQTLNLDTVTPATNQTQVDDITSIFNSAQNYTNDDALSRTADVSVLDRNKFKNWLKTNLPQLSLSDIDDISNLSDTMVDAFGLFRDKTIYLFEGSGEKTAYHEAFHGVIRNLLSVKQRQELFDEAKKRYAEPTQKELDDLQSTLKNKYSKNQLTYLYYEEKMADDFSEYTYNENNKSLLSKIGDKIKNLFNKILSYFNIFQSANTSSIDSLFDKINKGKLATATTINDSVVNMPMYGEYAYSKKAAVQLSLKDHTDAVNSISNNFLAKLQSNLLNPNVNIVKPSNIFNEMLDEYKAEWKKAVNANDSKKAARIAVMITNYPELINLDVKSSLKERGISVKERFTINKNDLNLEVKSEEDNSSISLEAAYDTDKIEDSEVTASEGKTTKGLAEWTDLEGMSSASGRLKLFLSSIPVIETDESGKPVNVKDNYGVQKYHDFNSTYYFIERHLIDIYELDEQIKKLSKLTAIRPELNQVIDKLTVRPSNVSPERFEMLRNDFKTNFSKQQLVYTLVKFNNDTNKGKISFEIIDANRATLTRQIKDQWINNFIQNPNVKSLTSTAWAAMIKNAPKLNYEAANRRLLQIGIEYTPDVLKSVIEKNNAQFKVDVQAVIDWYVKNNNTNFSKEVREAFERLVKLQFEGSVNSHTSSFVNGENKNIYTIQLPTFISKKLAKIKDPIKREALINDYFKDSFYKNSNLLNLFKDSNEYSKIFNISYLDSLKDDNGNRDGVVFTKLQPKDYLAMKVALFQNQAVNSQKFSSMPVNKYVYLVPADKSMSIIVDSTNFKITLAENGTIDINNSPILANYYNVFLQELSRIKREKALIDEMLINKDDSKLILLQEYYTSDKKSFETLSKYIKKSFEDGLTDEDWKYLADNKNKIFNGQSFKFNYFSTEFNKFMSSDVYKSLFDSSTEENIANNFNKYRKIIITEISKDLINDYDVAVKEWTDKGLIAKKDGLYEAKAIDVSTNQNGELFIQNTPQIVDKNIKNLILSYTANTKLHNIELSNILNGDYAQYKPNDLQKRTPQSQAFTVFGNFENKVIRTLLFKDYKTNSEKYGVIKESLEKLGFTESQINDIVGDYSNDKNDAINVTDAQVYITPEFFKRIHESRGTWSDELQEAYDIAEGKAVGNIKESLRRLLGGFKPFYFGERYDPVLKRMVYEQVKCSMLPLFKEYVDINPLMAEKLNDLNLSGSDMLAHESAFKAAIGFRDDIETNNYVTLDLNTDNFGIQVDNPDHTDDGNDATRQFKMILPGSIDVNKSYKGIPGSQILQEILDCESANIDEDIKDFSNKLYSADSEELNKFISEMVSKRRTTQNILDNLSIVDGDFKYPLDNGVLSTKIENMFSSIFTSNIVKQKFNTGGSLVQATSLGFKYKNLAEQQEFVEENKDLKLLQQQLEYIKPNVETGEIGYAEAAMPAHFKEFFDDKGFVKNIDGIPEELKQLIVYRIPTEGPHSMLPIKVVKFLPETMGNFILLPYEVTKQFGADFDFDKIYFIGREFYKVDDKLVPYTYTTGTTEEEYQDRYNQYFNYKTKYNEPYLKYDEFKELPIIQQNAKGARNNKIVDNYLTLLTSTENLANIVTPSGFSAIENFKNEFFSNAKVDSSKFFTDTTQNDYKDRNHIGRILKGIWALQVSGHSYGSMMPLSSQQFLMSGDLDYTKSVNFNGENRTVFNKLYNDDGKLISDTVGSILAAVLDDIKNPLLKDLNITVETSNALAVILRAGYNLRTTLLFSSQPVLKTYSELVLSNKFSIKENNTFFDVKTIYKAYKSVLDEVYNNYADKDNPAIQRVYNSINDLKLGVNSAELQDILDHYTIVDKKIYYDGKQATDEQKIMFYANQIRVLNQFEILDSLGKDLSKMNRFFAINKQIGPNIEDIIEKADLLNFIINDSKIQGFDITKIPTLESTWNAHQLANEYLKKYFPYSSDSYVNIKSQVIYDQTGKRLSDSSAEDRILINNFIRVYTDYSQDTFKTLPENQRNLMIKLPALFNSIMNVGNKDLKLNDLTYGDIATKSMFLQNLHVDYLKLSETVSIPYLKLKANRLNPEVQDQLAESFKMLFNNLNTKDLAINLIRYSMLTGGFYSSVGMYSPLISPKILEKLDYTKYRNEIINKLNSNQINLMDDYDRIFDQLVRNYPSKFTKIFDSTMFLEDFTKGMPKEINTTEFNIKEANRLNDMYLGPDDALFNPKYITVRPKNVNSAITIKPQLYKNTGFNTYIKIEPLGKKGFMLEINPFNDIDKSFFSTFGIPNNMDNVNNSVESEAKPVLDTPSDNVFTSTPSSDVLTTTQPEKPEQPTAKINMSDINKISDDEANELNNKCKQYGLS